MLGEELLKRRAVNLASAATSMLWSGLEVLSVFQVYAPTDQNLGPEEIEAHAVRAEARAIPRLTPMSASLDAPREFSRAPSTARGVSERANDISATSHSGDAELCEEARAART